MRYTPEPGPQSVENLLPYLESEFRRIGYVLSWIQDGNKDVLHQEPSRPTEGQIVIADGTDWDPGSGAGAYLYLSGAWGKL